MDPKTFCIVPWAHTRIWPNGNLSPCCKIDLKFPTKNISTIDSFDQWWNGDDLRNLRQDLNSGIKNTNCQACWNDEQAGRPSLRQEYNQQFAKHTDLKSIQNHRDGYNHGLPIALDLNLSNICNFKCVMCTPYSSSRIASEQRQHQDKFKVLSFINNDIESYDVNWPEQDLFQNLMTEIAPNIRSMELKGGEPLLVKNIIDIIKSIPNKKESVIALTTNGSVEIDDEFLAELAKFKTIWFFVSVDGIGELGEYIRYGSCWSQVDTTIKRVSQLKNCIFRLSVVLQFSSPATFPGIFEYAKINDYDVELVPCRSPRHTTIDCVLPEKMKIFQNWASQQVLENPNISYIKSLSGLLSQYSFNPELNNRCQQYISTINSIRKNHCQPVQDLIRQ
jgi:hypothetical protein